MRVSIIIALLSIIYVQTVSAQKVYSTDRQYQADVKVFVVDHEYQADLIVYKIDKDYRAKKSEYYTLALKSAEYFFLELLPMFG